MGTTTVPAVVPGAGRAGTVSDGKMCEVISVDEYEKTHGSLSALSSSARKSLRDAEFEMRKKFDDAIEKHRLSKGKTIISRSEVLSHNRINDCYVIINSVVYDVTSFLEFHPGGKQALLNMAGKDATTAFEGKFIEVFEIAFSLTFFFNQILATQWLLDSNLRSFILGIYHWLKTWVQLIRLRSIHRQRVTMI